MADWAQDFDTYLTFIEDAPASFLVDLAATRHAPARTHPVRVQVRLTLEAAGDSGLPDEDELERLRALEDRIVEGLDEHLGAIFVGHELSRGYLHVVAYAPRARVGDEATLLDWLDEDGYEVAWLVADDADWAMFFEYLVPSEWEMRTIWNRRLLERLEEHGDQLDAPRPIDHFAYFRREDAATRAAEALSEQGFAVKPPERNDDDEGDPQRPWALSFQRTDALAEGRADAVSLEIMDTLALHDGHYDGWGCAVVGQTPA